MKQQNRNITGLIEQQKPKYSEDDKELMLDLLDKETPIEDIFAVMRKRRPDVHITTIFRWIEKLSMPEEK